MFLDFSPRKLTLSDTYIQFLNLSINNKFIIMCPQLRSFLCYTQHMDLIREIKESDFGREVNENSWASFDERKAARAILVDSMSQIALMHVVNEGYYKLPGGGVDEGESFEQALQRELHEEAGADDIDILGRVGEIVEYREEWARRGVHACFLVRLKGDLNEPERTEKELTQGYSVAWAKNLDEAIELVESGNPKQYGQDFEKLREVSFLKYVRDNNLI